MELMKIAQWVIDDLFPTMDAEDVTNAGSSPNDPPDLVAHDRKYHHGHYDGKSACKYRQQREEALQGITDLQQQKDIIDKLAPEDVEGEKVDKADAEITGEETKSVSLDNPKIYKWHGNSGYYRVYAGEYNGFEVSDTFLAGDDEEANVKAKDFIDNARKYLDSDSKEIFNTDILGILDNSLLKSPVPSCIGRYKVSVDQADDTALKLASLLGASWAISPKKVDADVEKGIKDIDENLKKCTNPVLRAILERGRAHYVKENGADETPDKIEAVKAFAKAIGLDPAALGGLLGKSAAGDVSSKENLKKDADIVRQGIRNLSPRFAAIIAADLAAIEDGKDPSKQKNPDEKKEDKDAAKKSDKEAQKKAKIQGISAFNNWQKSSPAPLKDVVIDSGHGKVASANSALFESMWNGADVGHKIVAISDMHDLGNHKSEWDKLGIGDAGVVLIAGDMADALYSSPKYHETAQDQIKHAQEWIDRKFGKVCAKYPNTKFVMIPGNHDNILGIPEAKQLKWPSNATLLNDDSSMVAGMKIYGTGICEQHKGSSAAYNVGRHFELDAKTFKERADKIPEGLDILMIHQPPKDAGYEGDKSFFNKTGENCGSDYLTKIIKEKKPKMVIVGHLHQGDHRPYRIGDSVVINAARVADRSVAEHTPQRILFGEGSVDANGQPKDFHLTVDAEDNHLI